jgi:hypothetical protein
VNYGATTVSKCTINPSDGTFTSCGNTGPGFNNPSAIAIQNGYAYITQTSANATGITSYQISQSDGSLVNCVLGGNIQTSTFGIAVNSKYVYTVSTAGTKASVCPIINNTTFGACNLTPSSGSPFNVPFGVAFN